MTKIKITAALALTATATLWLVKVCAPMLAGLPLTADTAPMLIYTAPAVIGYALAVWIMA